MAALSIRNLDDEVRDRLRMRAAGNGRSMEAEARAILTEAVAPADRGDDLFAAIRERFGQLGGVELELPARDTPPRSPDLAG